MLHVFYLGVAYVSHLCCKCFIRMLHMFHTYDASVSSILYVFCNGYTHVFLVFKTYVANVSLRYCKVDLVLHILQPSVAAAGPACMRMGVEGAQAAGVGNCVGID
jgi:hypothetical protein